MHRLIDFTEWLLMAASFAVAFGVIVFAALAFRLNNPPAD